jgi:fermentation-respiration switch protein FrsA (DUF1100 family)
MGAPSTSTWKRRLVRLAMQLVLAYAGIVGLLLLLEDGLLYCPSGPDDTRPPDGIAVEDVTLTSTDGTSLHAEWSAPAGWKPAEGAVLFCHGNGGNLSHRRGVFRPWLQVRQGVLLFDYPGYGRSGGKPSEAGCYAAGDAALAWLTEVRQVPPRRVVIYGGSLGGAIAVDLAVRHPCRALFLVSTFTSFPDMAQKVIPWVPGRWLVRNQLNSLDKIGSCRVPVFIVHDRDDDLIPFSQGERLFAAAPEPKRFVATTGIHHNDQPGPEVYPELWRFLDACAPPEK